MLVAAGQKSKAWVFRRLAVGALAFLWVMAVQLFAEKVLVKGSMCSFSGCCLHAVEALHIWTMIALLLAIA